MEKVLYMAVDEGEELKRIMREHGFTVLVGDGILKEDMLKQCTVLVPGKIRFTREILEKGEHLKLICKYGVGMDRIDLKACEELGICVTNTPLANYISVAEHAMALMMTTAKKIYQMQLYLRRQYPEYGCRKRYQAVELYGKTLSVIGLGNIGRYVAKLAHGFEMKIVGYDPYPRREMIPNYIELAETLDEAISKGDFVSLHVAGIEENRFLIGARELAMMKPDAILINTTRGFVVDEKALFEALKDEKIGGAGLDVFEEEPIRPGNPLMFLENLVATPHNGANTREAHVRAELQTAQNILDFFDGKRPEFMVVCPSAIDL